MILLIYTGFSIISNVILVMIMKNAPEGWEDTDGFHLGKKPVQYNEQQIGGKIFNSCCFDHLSISRAHIF